MVMATDMVMDMDKSPEREYNEKLLISRRGMSYMRMKKTLSILLVICMLMGLFPMFSANVKAAESTDKTGDLYLDKTAVLEEDGSYTIKLEAYATGTPVTTQVKDSVKSVNVDLQFGNSTDYVSQHFTLD